MQKNFNKEDVTMVRKAVAVAEKGLKLGGGPFGAIIRKGRKIISESYNQVVISGDPTAHAEILAIRKACEAIGSHDLSGCVLYTSCEPCPMCLGAIYWSGIDKVFYGSGRHDAASAGFDDEYIYRELEMDPANRGISFCRIDGADSSRIFRIWEKMENKRMY